MTERTPHVLLLIANDIGIEEVTIVHEGIDRVYACGAQATTARAGQPLHTI